jgi:hypothetical protein
VSAFFFLKSKNKSISSSFLFLLYLLSLPFSWLQLLALSPIGSVGTIGFLRVESKGKKNRKRQYSRQEKKNVLVNTSRSLKENLPAPLDCHPRTPPLVSVKN